MATLSLRLSNHIYEKLGLSSKLLEGAVPRPRPKPKPKTEIVELAALAGWKQALGGRVPPGLAIWDLDQTVLCSPTQWGGEAWYYHLIDQYRAAGRSEKLAILEANRDWEAAQSVIDVGLMEPMTAGTVHALQTAGWRVMGLTTRAIGFAARTFAQLASVGVDFRLAAPSDRSCRLREDVTYENGVLFVGPLNPKGPWLEKFLGQIACRPAQIVLIDDRRAHLETVGKVARKLGVPYLGLRYAISDRLAAEFDPKVAAAEARRG
jgi:hypothetical protein